MNHCFPSLQLIIGNFGLSLDQARVQMAVWSVLAAPLLMSVELATIRPEFKEILLNKDIIKVDQDPLGKQGLRVWSGSNCEVIISRIYWKFLFQLGLKNVYIFFHCNIFLFYCKVTIIIEALKVRFSMQLLPIDHYRKIITYKKK